MACCCCSVAQSCPTFCDPMDCSTPGFPVLHHLPSLLKLMSIELVMPSNRLIPWNSLLFLPLIFSSIKVFSSELALHIRWPKYSSFSVSPSNRYSGLISIRIDWFDLLAAQEASPAPQLESISSLWLSLLYSPTLIFVQIFQSKSESFGPPEMTLIKNKTENKT